MEGAVYILCGLTALTCGLLLLRGYWRNPVKLLLWSALSFLALACENFVLFADVVLVPDSDLSLARNSCSLVGALLLMYGLIWESK